MSIPDKILTVLKRSGPQVSPKIAKEVKGEAILISAYLSELKGAGKVKISQMKIGSSPLYYLPGQEKQLVLFADRLNSKDKAVFDTLEQLKVLREAQLDLLSKVALRKMKDFAIPMQVSVGGKKELFWRWYMLDTNETNLIVSSLLQQVGPSETVEEVPIATLSTPAVAQPTQTAAVRVSKVPTAASLAANIAPKTSIEPHSALQTPEILENQYPPNTTVKGNAQVDSVYPENTAAAMRGSAVFEDTMQAQVIEVVNTADIEASTPSEIELATEEDSVQQQISDIEKKTVRKDISKSTAPITQKEDATENVPIVLSEEKKKEEISPTKEKVKEVQDKQKSLVEKIKEAILPRRKGKAGDLLPLVEAFCDQQEILVESSEVVRKNSELILHLLIPTRVGKVLFFCKVRRKKRCDEKDISAAYMEAQIAKLPLLFLYTGEITAKAQEFLDSARFDNLLLLKLDDAKK